MSAPALFAGLLDDAALFPPGEAPMARAVPTHRGYRAGPLAPFVGPFLVPDTAVPELRSLLAVEGVAEPLPVAVIVPGGAGTVAAALDGLANEPGTALVGVEIASRAEGDPAREVGRVVAALRRNLPEAVGASVEIPRGDPRPALDALLGTGYRAKFRTGGVRAEAFPDERELAGYLHAAIQRGLAFKCTAGLHHAVRHTAHGTGFEHHGFLNVLLATHAALSGAPIGDLASVLGLRDGQQLARMAASLGSAEIGAVRKSFTSYGTCSITEPIEDLRHLGLIAETAQT